MSAIFDLAKVAFSFHSNNTASLILEGLAPFPIETLQVYQVLGGRDLRVKIILTHNLPSLPSKFKLRYKGESTSCMLSLDPNSNGVSGTGVGTTQLDAIPASHGDQAILLKLLKDAANSLEGFPSA